MMANRFTDTLFQLVHSLEKSEKRHFKLYIKRSSAKEDLKIIQLYDALDKMEEYDEKILLKKLPDVTKTQLANLKNHLYKQLLASLRLLKTHESVDLQLSEHLDNARLLYNKGLKIQALRILEKAKELARANQKYNTLVQVLSLEKKIETLHITRSTTEKTEELAREAQENSEHINRVTKLSNLALLLYRWYVLHGHARNELDEADIKSFFKNYLPKDVNEVNGFYENLYLYQSYCWYAFIRLDFLQYYRYCQKWVDLFEKHPAMLAVETASYIKGMHNLMGAHFDLLNHQKLAETIKVFEQFARHKLVTDNDNNRILTYQYLYTARINLYFLQGTFNKGLLMVPHLEEMLKQYSLYLDTHRVLIFYYKIASLYFGSGDNEKAIDYLNRIIDQKAGLRNDLQCYARLLHLIAHYELGNFDLLEYLSKSVYRYMARMENLSKVEEEMFAFLRRAFHVSAHALKPEFEKLLNKLKKYEDNPLERRAFAYLDVISWLESKINHVNVQDVIREKYVRRKGEKEKN